MNRSIIPGGSLSTLLQGGIKTIPPSQPKPTVPGIKGIITLQKVDTIKIFVLFQFLKMLHYALARHQK